MSDHWNSIANLLKTPSINPTAKKTEGPPKPTKPSLPTESQVQNQPEPPVEALPVKSIEQVKSKAEPSRLRSSWDAVATFFGVAAPEQPSEIPQSPTIADRSTETEDATPVASSGRKNKPSMWGQPAEESQPAAIPTKSEPRIASRLESVDESQQTRGEESRDRGRSRGRDRTPVVEDRSTSADAPYFSTEPAPRRAPQSQRDEPSGAIDPERRAQRQQPRRGRQADVRADVAFGEPLAEPGFVDDVPPVTKSPEAERAARPERAPRQERERRPERGPRPEPNSRDDRPSRPPRLEGESRTDRAPRPARDENHDDVDTESRNERPFRPEGGSRPARSDVGGERAPRSDRGDRPARGEHTDRPPRTESGDRSARPERADRPPRPERTDGAARSEGSGRNDRPARTEGERRPQRDRPERTDRSAAPRGHRDAPTDRRPNPTVAKKPSGFGAGIQDDDPFGFVDAPAHSNDDFEQVDDRSEVDADAPVSRDSSDLEPRPRKRRGRGRRSDSRGNDSQESVLDPRDAADDRDEDDASDFISRNSRIPSWQDAIGTLVATNMENHQRNQSQNRGPRGRGGPRRDR